MAKNSPGTLNSRTVRIRLRTYLMLKKMSEHDGLTMAEALDKLITRQDDLSYKFPITAQMPMELVTYQVMPKSAIATNGQKSVAIKIVPGGVRYD